MMSFWPVVSTPMWFQRRRLSVLTRKRFESP